MKVSILVVVLAFFACGSDSPRPSSPFTFHLSTKGKDSAPGAESSPWRTLDKANRTAYAGDVIIVHEGHYPDGIHPLHSGKPGSPILFRAARGEHVVLDATIGIQLGPESRYIEIDGFEIHASTRLAEIVGSSNITVRNCKLYGGRGNYSTFSLDGASYCVIQDNYLDRQDPDGSSQSGDEPTGGDGLRLIGGAHHNLIEGNTVTGCEHVAMASSYSTPTVYQSYNIWRNNTAYNNHTNFALAEGVQRCLFENNTGYYPGLIWTGGNGNCFQFTGGSYCIVRFNTFYDDTGTVHIDRRWPALIGSGVCFGNNASLQYNKIYNNTVYGETDQREWKKAGWRIDNNTSTTAYQNNNVFTNNIIANTGDVQINDVDAVRSLASMNNRYEGNLLSGAGGTPASVRYEFSGGNAVWTLEEVKRAKPNQWASTNKEGNPLFVNAAAQGPAKDFRLQERSPAVDAAVHLTTATSGGTGTTLIVADAGYFCDGWGIPGIESDSIKIESEAPVGIASVDYTTNTITLNSPRAWPSNARIFYYRSDRFSGSAPDIGAHESPWNLSKNVSVTPGQRSPAR